MLIHAALLVALAAPHPNSLSGSTIAVEGARVGHEITLQGLSLLEVLPGADTNGDERLDLEELAAARDGIVAYLDRNYLLWSDEAREQPLTREVLSIELAPAPPGMPGPPDPWVRVRSSFEADAPIETLAVEMRLFFVTSPDHRDFLDVLWDGERAFATSLSQFEPDALFQAADLPNWFARGAREFITSFDRLAFLLALLIGVPAAAAGVRVALAYAAAQAAGFALAAPGLVALPPRFLGLSVALAAAFAGAQLLSRREARAMLLEALVFGAIGGLAFGSEAASAVQDLLLPAGPLIQIGLGQLGALLLVMALGVLGVALMRRVPPARLGRPSLVMAALVTLFGLYRFVQRAGWI